MRKVLVTGGHIGGRLAPRLREAGCQVRCLYTRIQPIAVCNVFDYLVAALETPESVGRVIEMRQNEELFEDRQRR